MATQARPISGTDEQTLISIVRELPPERISQLVGYARSLLPQAVPDQQDTPETISSEERWTPLSDQPEQQRTLLEMAQEAREDLRSGRATDIVFAEDGSLAPA